MFSEMYHQYYVAAAHVAICGTVPLEIPRAFMLESILYQNNQPTNLLPSPPSRTNRTACTCS